MNVNGEVRKANVVHFSTAHSVFDVRIFKKECISLARAGHHVTLIANGDKDATVDGVHIRSMHSPKGLLARTTVAVWRTYKHAVRHPGKIFHFHDPELLLVGLVLALRKKKVIYDVHENWPDIVLHKEWIPLVFRKMLSRLVSSFERYSARHMDGIVTAVEEIAAGFNDLNVPVVAVHNYPLLREFPVRRQDDPSPSPVGVHFGGVSSERVTYEMVQALGDLPANMDFRLTLGGVCDSPELLAQVSKLPGWARVDYTGMISRHLMLQEISKASMALILYSDCPNHMDIRSNRLFEALAAGMPVIVPDFPKWREFIHETACGLMVNPHDPGSIARAIVHLLEHPREAMRMGARGRQLFERKFNWEGEEAKLLGLYNTILLAS